MENVSGKEYNNAMIKIAQRVVQMKEERIDWENIEEHLDTMAFEGVLDGEESQTHIITSEEEFQELIKALHSED